MIDFTSVQGTWDDQPLYIIGGGPSLQGFDFDKIVGKGRLLGVNDAALNSPCDALFSIDQTWYKNRKREIQRFKGEKYFAAPPNFQLKFEGIENVNYLVRRRSTGFTDDIRDINGVNSGYGALHLAYHKRAKEIYLLGFDMKDSDKAHWYERYKWHAKEAHAGFHKVAKSFDDTLSFFQEYGAKVINACPHSLITVFEKCSLEDL